MTKIQLVDPKLTCGQSWLYDVKMKGAVRAFSRKMTKSQPVDPKSTYGQHAEMKKKHLEHLWENKKKSTNFSKLNLWSTFTLWFWDEESQVSEVEHKKNQGKGQNVNVWLIIETWVFIMGGVWTFRDRTK